MSKSSTANRGLKFEENIQKKCDKLKEEGIALISKVPTEFKILRRFNPKTKRSEIYSAFGVEESKFVDFVGIMNSKPVAIEAKETKNKTSFPFKNIKNTQIEFFNLWSKLDGKGYYLIHFVEHKEIYLVPCEVMKDWIDNIGRQSVPYETFKNTKDVILLDYKKLNFEEYIK